MFIIYPSPPADEDDESGRPENFQSNSENIVAVPASKRHNTTLTMEEQKASRNCYVCGGGWWGNDGWESFNDGNNKLIKVLIVCDEWSKSNTRLDFSIPQKIISPTRSHALSIPPSSLSHRAQPPSPHIPRRSFSPCSAVKWIATIMRSRTPLHQTHGITNQHQPCHANIQSRRDERRERNECVKWGIEFELMTEVYAKIGGTRRRRERKILENLWTNWELNILWVMKSRREKVENFFDHIDYHEWLALPFINCEIYIFYP